MIKKLVFSGAMAWALTIQSGLAADLPSRKAPPVYPAPVFTWTGFHVGFDHGFGGGVVDAEVTLGAPGLGFLTTQTSNRASGFIAGGQAGYDYQFPNNLVVGLETDFQWSDIRASHQATTVASILAGVTFVDIHNELDWFGTTRLRVGYSLGRLLPYVTGGVAYGEMEFSGRQFAGGALFSGSATDTKVGWTVGAGADYALTDHLSARVEYLFLQLPGVGAPAIGLLPPPLPPLLGSFSTGSFGAHIVRTGLNWKFNGFGDFAGLANGGLLDLLTAAPTVGWAGFHVGVNGGLGGNVTDAVITLASPVFASSTGTTNRTFGPIGGGQVGYDYQFSKHIIFGLETDGQWSDIRASHQATTAGVVFTDIRNGLNWFGTTRVRAGWTTGATLVYLTGGVAYGEVSASGTQFVGGALFTGSAAETKAGWTAGAGTEYALTDNVSLKAEYLYVNFDGVSGPVFGVIPGAFSTGTFGTHITRAGLNWRFGGFGAAPVVAKY